MGAKALVVWLLGAVAALSVAAWILQSRDEPETGVIPNRSTGSATEGGEPLSASTPAEGAGPRTEVVLSQHSSIRKSDRKSDGELNGRVYLPDRSPAAGETVQCFRANYPVGGPREIGGQPASTAITDSSGWFGMTIELGEHVLVVSPQDPTLARTLTSQCYAGQSIPVVLKKGASARGIVTIEGAHLGGVNLELSRKEEYGTSVYCRTTTDTAGEFILAQLEPGDYILDVAGKGMQVVHDSFTLRSGQDIYRDIALELSRSVEGVVFDLDTGAPLSGAEVSLRSSFHSPTTTNSDGLFMLRLATEDPPGIVFARAEGYGRGDARVVDGGEGIGLRVGLSRGGRARGSVVAGGQPLGGARVRPSGFLMVTTIGLITAKPYLMPPENSHWMNSDVTVSMSLWLSILEWAQCSGRFHRPCPGAP